MKHKASKANKVPPTVGDEALKAGALWLIHQVGLPPAEAARDVGVHPNTVRKWLRQDAQPASKDTPERSTKTKVLIQD